MKGLVLFISALACLICHGLAADWYTPEQTHIAVGDTPDKMIIVWSTFNDTGDSVVRYGSDPSLPQNASGSAIKFTDEGPQKRFQFIHRVILQGLKPKTVYYYKVGSVKFGFSQIFKFRTWPAGEDWSPRMALFGDMGVENEHSLKRLIADTEAGMYDAILHVGDFAYDMDSDNALVGDAFMREIEPLASRLPYMTCPGNHENAYNFSNYRNRFWMPGDENKQTYYTFNMGPVHFISISTELIFYPQYGLEAIVDQYRWLERALEDANKPENRAKRPWVILFGHRPMYCSNDNNDDCTHHESLIRVGIPFLHVLGLEPLLYKYGVDLALWAHEHSYERLWPVYDRKVYNGSYKEPYTNPGAPVHIITGSAGCKEKHDKFYDNVDDWSAFRSDDYGYARMIVHNRTHLYMEQVSDDKQGKVIDSLMVVKNKHGPFHPNPPPVKPAFGHNVLERLSKDWKPYVQKMKVFMERR